MSAPKTPEEILEAAQALHDEAEATLAGNGITGVRAYLNVKERKELRRWKAYVKEVDEENAALRARADLLEYAYEKPKAKPIRIKPNKSKPPKSIILALSDTHTTELVDPKETHGRNEHNYEIGRERLRSVVLQAIDEAKVMARRSDLQHATVWLGGDFMVNADLHYKFERNTPYEPLEEYELVYNMLHEELKILLARLPVESVSIVGSVSNHDRDTDKMQLGMASRRSYDTAAYRRLQKDFPEPVWDIAETYWTRHTVGDFTTLYHHGHALSQRQNNAGSVVPAWAKLQKLQLAGEFQCSVQGHYHTAASIISTAFSHVSNGSTVGDNGYSTDCGFPPEAPAQQLVLVNHDQRAVERVATLYA